MAPSTTGQPERSQRQIGWINYDHLQSRDIPGTGCVVCGCLQFAWMMMMMVMMMMMLELKISMPAAKRFLVTDMLHLKQLPCTPPDGTEGKTT